MWETDMWGEARGKERLITHEKISIADSRYVCNRVLYP